MPGEEKRHLWPSPRARGEESSPPPVRDGRVVLFDPAEHLRVERLLEWFGRLHHLVGVGVLGPDVREDLRIVLLPEPGVVVLTTVAVDNVHLRDPLRERR